MVGNDKEKLISGQEKDKCDLVIELVCEKYDTPRTEAVTNFGIHDGSFEGLEYDTKYTLNVYMMEFMDINKAYLIEPQTFYISSGSSGTQYINIDATHDSNDVWTFYASVSYYEDTSMYHDFYLELYEGSYDDYGNPIPIDPNAGEGNFVCYVPLNDYFYERQQVEFDIIDYECLYWVAFGGMIDPTEIQSTRPPLRADSDIPPESHAILWELIDFSEIPVEYIEIETPPQNTIHFDAISDPFGNCEYYSYVEFYDDKPEYYSNYEVDIYTVLYDENTDEPIDFPDSYPNWENWYVYSAEEGYGIRQYMNDFTMPTNDRYYWAVFECDSTDPVDTAGLDSDSGSDYAHITLFWQLIDVTQIPTVMVETHNEFYGKAKYVGSFTNYYGYFMIEDAYYYDNLYWQLVEPKP